MRTSDIYSIVSNYYLQNNFDGILFLDKILMHGSRCTAKSLKEHEVNMQLTYIVKYALLHIVEPYLLFRA